ncbi:MAG: hypothetical protein PHW73_07695 [Atribacterota bacterium]|nr:hypothetical protein [Atribacterota bacterium]
MRKAKKIKLMGVLLIVILIILGISGCSGNSSGDSSNDSERYGVDITKQETTSIKDILTNSKGYLDQTVKLEGKIVLKQKSDLYY